MHQNTDGLSKITNWISSPIHHSSSTSDIKWKINEEIKCNICCSVVINKNADLFFKMNLVFVLRSMLYLHLYLRCQKFSYNHVPSLPLQTAHAIRKQLEEEKNFARVRRPWTCNITQIGKYIPSNIRRTDTETKNRQNIWYIHKAG